MAKSGKDAQASFRLPQSLYDQLKAAAGDRPIGDEMRRRLEASFQEASEDEKTREVVAAIAWALNALQADGDRGHWHEDPKVFPEARTAILGIIDRFRPEGAPDTTDSSISTFLAGIALLHVRGEL